MVKKYNANLGFRPTVISAAVLMATALFSIQANAQVAVEEIVVIGSQIKGLSNTGALPVTVIGSDDLDAIGASSTEDLLRSIPQVGEIQFNSDETGTWKSVV